MRRAMCELTRICTTEESAFRAESSYDDDDYSYDYSDYSYYSYSDYYSYDYTTYSDDYYYYDDSDYCSCDSGADFEGLWAFLQHFFAWLASIFGAIWLIDLKSH